METEKDWLGQIDFKEINRIQKGLGVRKKYEWLDETEKEIINSCFDNFDKHYPNGLWMIKEIKNEDDFFSKFDIKFWTDRDDDFYFNVRIERDNKIISIESWKTKIILQKQITNNDFITIFNFVFDYIKD